MSTNTLKQQIKSGYALRAVRQAEAMAGHTVSQHYSPGGFRLLSTPAIRHKRGPRRPSKLVARYREHVAVQAQRLFGRPVAELDMEMLGEWGL